MGRHRLYTRESVEAALDLHAPGRWRRQSGQGYALTRLDGQTVRFTTLKEAHAYCVGAADADQRARILA